MPKPALEVPDRFEVERVVASGGMGGVYLALDRQSGKRVALKVLHNGVLDDARFEREAVLLASLEHDAIVRYVAHGRIPDGRPYIAMEWLEGEDLGKRLSRGPLDPTDVLKLARRVAEGLDVVHRAGLVHRDVKPDNIFVVDRRVDRAKIVDFGLARRPRAMVLTIDGQVVGTPGYMAPEQIKGDIPDPRVDIFALGCVLYHCAAGKAPFRGANSIQVLTKVILEEPEPLASVCPNAPAALISVVRRAMTKERAQRPLDARAFLGVLDGALGAHAPSRRFSSSIPISNAERGLAAVLVVAWFSTEHDPYERSVEAVASQFGARVAAKLGHGAVLTFASEGMAAEEQAVLAARAALELTKLPALRASLAMVHAERGTVTEAIERAGTTPASWPRGSVLVDDVTLSLLPSRFERVPVGTRSAIVAERDALDLARTVLGKPTPFVGRDAERGALTQRTAQLLAQRTPGVIFVFGDAGVGKSRLRQEALRALGSAESGVDLTVFAARGDVAQRDIPLRAIGGMLRRAAAIVGESADTDRRKLFARVSRSVGPEEAMNVARFLGQAVGVSFEDADPALGAALRERTLMSDKMKAALAAFLSAEGRASNVLVIVEDAQVADAASLELLNDAFKKMHDARAVMWVVARPTGSSAIQDVFKQRSHELRLGPLEPASIAAIGRAILGRAASDAELDAIAIASAGNPLFAEETARAYAEHTLGGASIAAPLVLYEARLSSLRTELRAILKAASVMGTTFWCEALGELLGGLDIARIERACDELVQLELLEDRPFSRYHGHRELAFRSDAIRDAAASFMLAEDLERGHEVAGRWLERIGESDPLIIAKHFEAAKRGAAAAPYLLRAADRALVFSDFASAAALAERGLEGAQDQATRGALLCVLAETHRWQGDYARALERAKLAVATLENLTGEAEARWFDAVGEAVTAASRLRRLDELAHFADALLRRRSPVPVASQVISTARAAMLLEYAGITSRAAPLYDWVERVVSRFETDPLVCGRVLFARSWRAQAQGRLDSYRALLQAARVCFERAGDERTLAQLEANEAHACMELGEYERAVALSEAALSRAEKTGNVGGVALAKHNLGFALGRVGRVEEGIAMERESRDAYKRIGDTRFEGACSMYLALLYSWAGRPDEATTEAARAVELLERVPLSLSHALATAARIDLARGRTEAAVAHAQRAHEVLEAAGRCEGNPVEIHCVLAEALLASGQSAGAQIAIARGQQALGDAANRIFDPALRTAFLEKVAANARIAELAQQMGKTAPG